MSYRKDLLQAFEQHYVGLRAFVRRHVGSADTATDVLNDCYQHIARYSGHTPVYNPLAYLHRVASSLIFDRSREHGPRPFPPDPVGRRQLLPDNGPDAYATLVACQRLERLARAVEELPPRCREVFLLRKLEHLRVEQISLRLGISNNLIENNLRKALLHCRSRLADGDDAWHASAELLFAPADPPQLSEPTCLRGRGTESAHERAAEWALRVDTGECSDMEWRELERWLAADSPRLTMFEDACGLWGELDEVAQDVVFHGTTLAARTPMRPRADVHVQPRRRRFTRAEVFATTAGVIALVLLIGELLRQ